MKYWPREVKEDRKGLFIHYGGARVRPLKRETKARVGETIEMEPLSKSFNVFIDGHKEKWQAKYQRERTELE